LFRHRPFAFERVAPLGQDRNHDGWEEHHRDRGGPVQTGSYGKNAKGQCRTDEQWVKSESEKDGDGSRLVGRVTGAHRMNIMFNVWLPWMICHAGFLTWDAKLDSGG
jgi:hypothetical protein